MTKRKLKNQGMNWIRPVKRLAIYLRDGLSCSYCARGLEGDTVLTLDHLTVYCRGGSNGSENLVTCCRQCNSSRGVRGWKEFSRDVSTYVGGANAKKICERIQALVKTDLAPFIIEAEKIMSRRSSFGGAINSLR